MEFSNSPIYILSASSVSACNKRNQSTWTWAKTIFCGLSGDKLRNFKEEIMIINHNMRAINTHRQMGATQTLQAKN